ncbi:hypothetical protein QNI16_12430 [Cytophagaceae bacterium YF14B1]|uniref:Uncharacterized protein n=1 Tax=Xanthocytophaga flava TaxID=3048013 RepID=A0AAE3QPS4_9BACT|nr:hypothetical protein [Xanthocytophaga flavus]MDJ1481295.1 hypothetical protein [Xanthocytophaga flavus]
MDSSIEKRLEDIYQKMEKFGIKNSRLAEAGGISLFTVAKVLSEKRSDPRYLTDGNISAIESAIEKILDEYRQELCGEKKAQ